MTSSNIQVAGTKNVPLHHENVAFLKKCTELDLKPYETITTEDGRKQMLDISRATAGSCDFNGSTRDLKVPSADIPAGIPVRVYTPQTAPKDLPIIVYFHGGCQIVGSIETHDVMCKTLVNRISCLIVSVEYRLAPEHKLPAGLDDAETVTRWVMDNREHIGGTAASPVGVAGDSAGGQTAASVAHRLPGLSFQVLIYPMLDLTYSYPSIQEFPEGPGITQPLLQWALQQLADESDASNPRYSPIFQPSFKGLPPALVILAQIDCLRDEGRAYAKKLIDAGVPVDVLELQGIQHGFFNLPGSFPEMTDVAYGKLKAFLTTIRQ